MRLNKYLSSIGFCSRRQADKLITAQRIKIGEHLAVIGDQLKPGDQVFVDGKPVKSNSQKYYFLLHKPPGIISTSHDTHGRQTVVDLIPSSVKLFPVGRLDANSSGLIILTNDGDLALKLTHPRYHLPKTYLVKVKGDLSPAKIDNLKDGILLDHQKTLPAQVKLINPHTFEIILYQGLKRQIRLMCAALHLHILSLVRTQIGPISIGSLKPGSYRPLTPTEIKQLYT